MDKEKHCTLLLHIFGLFFLLAQPLSLFSQENSGKALLKQAKDHYSNSKLSSADSLLQRIIQNEKDAVILSETWNLKGHIYSYLGMDTVAMKAYETAYDFAKSSDDKILLAKTLGNLGGIYEVLDKKNLSGKRLREAKRIFLSMQDSLSAMRTNIALVNHLLDIGNEKEAVDLCFRAITYFSEKQMKLEESYLSNNLGIYYKNKGIFSLAVPLLKRSIELKESLGEISVVNGYKSLSETYKNLGLNDSALVYLNKHVIFKDSLAFNEMQNEIQKSDLKHELELSKEKLTYNELLLEVQRRKSLEKNVYIGVLSLLFTVSALLLILYLRRIRDIKRLNAKLDVSNQKLTEQNLFNQNILNILSHDIKNYLVGIGRIAQILHENQDEISNEKQQSSILNIKETSFYLVQLFKSLLLEYKWATKHEEHNLKKTRINLMAKIEEHTTMQQRFFENRPYLISVDTSEDEVWIDTDAELLNSIIRNLIQNAAKHSLVGTKILIEVCQQAEEFHVKIMNKVGKKPSFQQPNKSNSGYGLHFTKEIATFMGYQLNVNIGKENAEVTLIIK